MTQRYQFDLGTGIPMSLTITAPAAGAEFTYTSAVPTYDEILGLSFQFVTDVNVAARRIRINFTDGVRTIGRGLSGIVQNAGQTGVYSFGVLCPTVGVAAASFTLLAPISTRIFIPFNGTIDTTTDLIQVGDQFSAIALYVLRRFGAF